MSVSRALRYQVLRRDDHTCRYCGRSAPEVKLTIDHVTPTALGGSDEASNLVTACADCNGGKSAIPPDAAHVAEVSEAALRWSEAMRHASAALEADRQRRDLTRDDFLQTWNNWTYEGTDGERHTVELPNSWPTSIDGLAAAGLPLTEILDAIDIAMRAERVQDTFRYFCGVAWTKARQLHDLTQQMVEGAAEVDEEPGIEGRSGSCRIRCSKCQEVLQIAVVVVGDDGEGPLRLDAGVVDENPFVPRMEDAPEPIAETLKRLFPGAPS